MDNNFKIWNLVTIWDCKTVYKIETISKNVATIVNLKTRNRYDYKLDKLKITDDEVIKKSGKEFHPIAMKTGISNDMINGTIYEITEEDIKVFVQKLKHAVEDIRKITMR